MTGLRMAISSNTPIPILDGWTLAKNLSKGDWVFSKEGKPIQIKSVQTYTPAEMFCVALSDGVYVDVDAHTKFPIQTLFDRQTESRYRGIYKRWAKQKYASPLEMLERGLDGGYDQGFYSVRTTKPIHFPFEDHPVPPFIVGMWMTRTNPNNRYMLRESMVEYVQKEIRKTGWSFKMHPRNVMEIRPSIRTSFLTRYQTVPTKLPIEYTFGSVEQRIDLLRGVIATKPGSYNEKLDKFLIFSRNLNFLIVLQGICESLGMKTQVFENKSSFTHQLAFKSQLFLNPLQKSRKISKHFDRRIIKTIEKIDPKPSIHIVTDEPFVVGQGFLPIWH